MGCQNSKVRSASTTEAAPFKPAVAKDVLASRTFSLPPASPISSPARSRRASDADSQHAAVAAVAAATAAPATEVPPAVAVELEMIVVETSEAPTDVPCPTEAAPVAVLEEAPAAVGSNGDAVEVAVVSEEDEKVDAEATVAAPAATEEEAPVVEAAPVPSTVTFVEEARPEEVDEKKDEAKEAPAAVAVAAMEERPKSATNVRRVAFDKETMRRTAPRSAPTVPPAGTQLTKKQQQMYQAGHKSAGRRGPVASKHSRCKAQMQEDVYLAMANAFERLLTNVNTIDAHLDSR